MRARDLDEDNGWDVVRSKNSILSTEKYEAVTGSGALGK